jgi:NAD+ diphosphatase
MTLSFDLGPPHPLGYTHSPLTRAADLRANAARIAELQKDDRARAYLTGGELVVLRKRDAGIEPLFTLAEAAALGTITETIFLGLRDGAPRFGFGLGPDDAERLKQRDDLLVTDLRSIAVQGLAGPDDLPPIAEAKALLHWHASHRFCANCGAATAVTQAGWKRECPACGREHFPRTDPVAIMLTINGDKCLLGRSPRFAPTMWSCLAGFVEPGESFEDAVRRETLEESGVACGRVTYLTSQPWPFPMSLMIGCYAAALSSDIVIDRSELEDVRWFTREECAAMLMRRHPQELTCPPPVAIAYHIIRGWVERGAAVLG